MLQSFRGKGRGRGFEAIPSGSGFSDPNLAKAVQEKVETITRAFEVHGFPIAPLSEAPNIADTTSLRDRIADLEREAERGHSARIALQDRVKELESELERDRHLRLNTLAQVGKLSSQLERANDTQDQLFAASRQCIMSLRQLREQLKGVPFAAQSLSPLVRDVKGVLDLIQELRTVSSIRAAAADDLITR